LEITEVFDVFDFPRLFLASNRFGSRFLVLSVAEEASELVWLYLPVSEERLADLKECRLSLRTAFVEAEGGLVEVRVGASGEARLNYLREASNEWLPGEGEYLQAIPSSTTLPAAGPLAKAQRIWRDVVHVAFGFREFRGLTAPLRPLADLFSSFQQSLDTLGAASFGHRSLRGPLPGEILERTQLEVTGAFESSFGVVLASSTQADLFGNSLAGEGLAEFVRIAQLSRDRERLVAAMRELGARGASRYRVFLKALDSAAATADIRWSSPVESRAGSAFLGRDEIREALATLTAFELAEVPPLELVCRLIGLNVRTKTYEILSESDHKKYSGRVADQALVQVSHATINARYLASLKPLFEVNTTTGEERTRFYLFGLVPFAEGA
jgi:hypothetical protein